MTTHQGREILHFQLKNGTEAVIRYLMWDDIRSMQHFVNTVSKEDTYILLSGEEFSYEQEADFIAKQLVEIEKKDAVYLLCFIDDRLVGTFSAHRNTYAKKRELHIANLGLIVAKETRGQGIGKMLMEQGLQEVKNEMPGITMLTLAVFSTNSIGHKLYKKLGFIENGRLPGGIRHKDSFVDHIFMYKRI